MLKFIECVIQRQDEHIEHLIQKLQDVIVNLNNNWDNKQPKTTLSCCCF